MRTCRPKLEISSALSRSLPTLSWRRTSWLLVTAASVALPACETDDPCALRQEACVDVVLIGKKDDGAGNPIAYRDLKVSIYAPNFPAPASAPPEDKCEVTMVAGKPVRRVFGGETSPAGTLLASLDVPALVRKEAYSPTIQAKLTFKLPREFNALSDTNLDDELLKYSDDDARIAGLKRLRDSDPRSVRVIVTQAGQTKSAWDSRCEEAVFSGSEWLIKRYYRVGQNQHAGVFAAMEGAVTSSP